MSSAQFRAGDPDELVAASLACRYCLHTADAIEVVEDHLGASVRCHCLTCQASTDVLVDHEQLLRLALRPPPTVHVHLRASR